MMRQLFYVVHQAIQLPLPVHFGFSTQCKSVQSFIAAQVSEHRLHRSEAPGDPLSAHVRVDLGLHPFDVRVGNPSALEEGHLAGFGFMRRAQAFFTSCARHAVLLCAGKLHRDIPIDRAVRAVAI